MTGEYDTHNDEVFVKKRMETVKKLRELLSRLSFDFDQDKVGRTPEIIIPDVESGTDEKAVQGVRFEVEDVGQDPVQRVCRLVQGHGDVVRVYSIVMREHQHTWAQDGKFSDVFWASARLDADNNFTLINGMILPEVMMDGWRLIPTDQQLNPERRAAKVDLTDLDKISKIVEAVKKTLPPKESEVGGVALRLVE